MTDKICVMGSDPVGPNECRPEDGAPLVCNGVIVGITACDVTCFGTDGQPCFFKKISYLDDYVFQ
uniref:Peptidase S1 domain-containing protein n=1 Tax=Lutzomyia longipalpis TaxID=7200 RepID=A0A1B0CL10_LUTLO